MWSKRAPILYPDFVASRAARAEYWAFSKEMWPAMAAATPNAGHLALADAERRGRLAAVVTQNIDGLHQRAGSRRVIELHGTATRVGCLSCPEEWPRNEVQAWLLRGETAPKCPRCGGVLKPKTISFGQPMPERELAEACEVVCGAELLVVVGSSLVVHPAAQLPAMALAAGARLVIVNREPTPYDAEALAVLRAPAGETLPALAPANEGA